MYSGRRAIKDNQPIFSGRSRWRMVNRKFQSKYTLALVFSILFLLSIVCLPVIYFTQQNYQIFYELAYESAPEMLLHLEREIKLLTIYLVSISAGAIVFFAFIGIRITARFASPVMVIENHMRKMAKGRFYLPEVKIRRSDEFPELIRSYNYLCASLRTNAKSEIDLLRQIPLNPNDLQASNQVRSIIETKDNQINQSAG